jgi:dCMP deaminase
MKSTAVVPVATCQEVWDRRFLSMARLVSSWSKDPSTKVGAVIVTPENVLVSVGYNGFAQAMPDVEKHYIDREAKYSRIVHSETNAIVLARGDVRGHTLYVTLPPCDRCAVTIIQAGISRVACPEIVSGDAELRWKEAFAKARQYFDESGVTFDKIKEERISTSDVGKS